MDSPKLGHNSVNHKSPELHRVLRSDTKFTACVAFEEDGLAKKNYPHWWWWRAFTLPYDIINSSLIKWLATTYSHHHGNAGWVAASSKQGGLSNCTNHSYIKLIRSQKKPQIDMTVIRSLSIHTYRGDIAKKPVSSNQPTTRIHLPINDSQCV
jgi:hypothetical protein